jgi:transposase
VRRLSPGSASDDPEGQKLMEQVPKNIAKGKALLMDKAYEGDACRKKAKECGMRPVVPPKSNRKEPWKYNKKLYKRRHIVECNFRNIKQFRRVFTRYDKLDETYNAFIAIANISRFLRKYSVNTT